MSQEMILPKSLQNRRCYTMADVLQGRDSGDKTQQDMHALMANPLFKTLMKSHALTTDSVSTVSDATGIVLNASSPLAIGRSLVRIIETTKTSVEIRLPRFMKAVKSARSKKGASGGTRNDYKIINVTEEIEASELWDRKYLEDADYDVAAEEGAALGRNHDVLETSDIITFINGITASTIAGGANLSAITPNTFTFNDIVNLWNQVTRTDFIPDLLVLHPDQLADLMKDDEFKDSQILGEFFDPKLGRFGSLIMGLNILSSSLMTPGTVFVMSSNDTVMYPLRRDKMITSFQPSAKEFEMQVTTRFGIDTGRPETMSRMVNA